MRNGDDEWRKKGRRIHRARSHLKLGDKLQFARATPGENIFSGKTVLYEAVLVRIAPLLTSEGNGSFKETALYLGFRKGGGLNAGFEMKGIKPGEVGAYYGSPK